MRTFDGKRIIIKPAFLHKRTEFARKPYAGGNIFSLFIALLDIFLCIASECSNRCSCSFRRGCFNIDYECERILVIYYSAFQRCRTCGVAAENMTDPCLLVC